MSDELNLDPSLAYDNNTTMANATPQQQNILPHPGQYPPDRITVVVDRQHFIHTRNALNNAFMSLSSSIDRAVKAYADHTDAVISGDHTLDVSGLLNPFNQITQFAQQFNPAFFAQYNNGQAPIAPMEGNGADAPKTNGKKKRAYKQRDVNAPKRPLTAYFRFLKEQRPVITAENAETPGGEGGKAGDISKIATERWKALTDAQRAPYKLAYQHELEQYERDTKAYKDGLSTGVKLGAEDDEDAVMATPSAGPSHVVAKADDEDEDDEDSDASTSSEEDSDDDDESSEEEVPAKAPSPPTKKSKSAKKASVTAGADPAPQQMFSSLNPIGGPQPSSSAQKRKASDDDDDEGGKKKKRGRPTKAEQEAAAAASQLLADESANVKKEKKKEKKEKKRKSEGAA